MAKFHSFRRVLREACRSIRPARYFEWGPGRSTEIVLEETEADVVSVEHDHAYFEAAMQRFASTGRVEIVLRPLGQRPGRSGAYVTEPFYRAPGISLFFVDGRQRSDCLLAAAACFAPGGLVILHDAERKAYRRAFDWFEQIEERDSCAILRSPRISVQRTPPDPCAHETDL